MNVIFPNSIFEKPGFVGEDLDTKQTVFVLRDSRNLFFREYTYNPVAREPVRFWWVRHLACARPYESRVLASAFVKYLEAHGFNEIEIIEVDYNRLLRVLPREKTKTEIAAAAAKVKDSLRRHLLAVGASMRRTVEKAMEVMDGLGTTRLRKSRRHHQKGFAVLLEVVLAMGLLMVLMAGATVNLVRIRAYENEQIAKTRLRQVAQAVFSVNYCAIPANACNAAALAATLPAPGSVVQQFGYRYTMTVNPDGAWNFIAIPIAQGFTGQNSYFISGDTILRCGTDAGAPPC